jgi:N-acetylglutamate synthase-like GNAT family acetyltransferase
MGTVTIRPVDKADRNWIAQFLDKHWGSTRVVSRGQVYLAHLLPGFIAEDDDEKVGLITYRFDDESGCEIVTINSTREGEGIGTLLIETVKQVAAEEGCQRIWLITTNDNLNALRFYQKRGFHLVAVYPNALDQSRKVKPEIPLFGHDGIPLRDELELEIKL